MVNVTYTTQGNNAIYKYGGTYATQTVASTDTCSTNTTATTAGTRGRWADLYVISSYTQTTYEVIEKYSYPEPAEYPEIEIKKLVTQVENIYFVYINTAKQIRAPPGR